MKKELLLNNLNCILIDSSRNTIPVEINGIKQELSSDDVFEKVNFNDIEDIIVNEEDSSFIKFTNGQTLVILHGSDHLDNNIDKEVLFEYEKFLEENGEKLHKEYKKVMG